MIQFDPRTISTPVFDNLKTLKAKTQDSTKLKEQKSQAVELYTYLATWGLMRLKAEALAQKQGSGKKQMIQCFFETLEQISQKESLDLDKLKVLEVGDYLGLTGLALQLAREYAFWSKAVYADVKIEGES